MVEVVAAGSTSADLASDPAEDIRRCRTVVVGVVNHIHRTAAAVVVPEIHRSPAAHEGLDVANTRPESGSSALKAQRYCMLAVAEKDMRVVDPVGYRTCVLPSWKLGLERLYRCVRWRQNNGRERICESVADDLSQYGQTAGAFRGSATVFGFVWTSVDLVVTALDYVSNQWTRKPVCITNTREKDGTAKDYLQGGAVGESGSASTSRVCASSTGSLSMSHNSRSYRTVHVSDLVKPADNVEYRASS